MMIQRQTLTALMIASAFVAAGCTPEAFQGVNTTFIAAKKGSATLSKTALPAAAIATSLGAIEIVKALSGESSAKIIAGGGGNIIAAGSGNLVGGPKNWGILADDTKVIEAGKVKLNVKYTSGNENGAWVSRITECKGKTNGYDLSLVGSFSYKPGQDSAGAVECSMTGDVTYDTFKLTVKELKFATTDPLPTKGGELGSFHFEQTTNGKVAATIKAAISYNGSGKIEASGSLEETGKPAETISFNEDKPSLDGTGDAAGTGGNDQ